MGAYTRSMEVKASSETIWRIWSDTETWAEWNPDIKTVKLNGPFATGTTGQFITKADTRNVELVSVEPGRSFTVEMAPLPMTKFAFRSEVAPSGEGMSKVSQTLMMSGPLAPVFSALMGNRIADTFPAWLRGLAGKAEAESGG